MVAVPALTAALLAELVAAAPAQQAASFTTSAAGAIPTGADPYGDIRKLVNVSILQATCFAPPCRPALNPIPLAICRLAVPLAGHVLQCLGRQLRRVSLAPQVCSAFLRADTDSTTNYVSSLVRNYTDYAGELVPSHGCEPGTAINGTAGKRAVNAGGRGFSLLLENMRLILTVYALAVQASSLCRARCSRTGARRPT